MWGDNLTPQHVTTTAGCPPTLQIILGLPVGVNALFCQWVLAVWRNWKPAQRAVHPASNLLYNGMCSCPLATLNRTSYNHNNIHNFKMLTWNLAFVTHYVVNKRNSSDHSHHLNWKRRKWMMFLQKVEQMIINPSRIKTYFGWATI